VGPMSGQPLRYRSNRICFVRSETVGEELREEKDYFFTDIMSDGEEKYQ
jgi:hypothetical protein